MIDLMKAIAVTAELTGTEWSKDAARAVAEELSQYRPEDVLVALKECSKGLKGRLTLSEIINRIPSGHPGPEEAWATIARGMRDDGCSMIWSEEMREAYRVANEIAEDEIAARMTFKEVYAKAVSTARNEGRQPNWCLSMGTDKAEVERVVLRGLQHGKLTPKYARTVLPFTENPEVLKMIATICPRLLS